MIKSRFQYFKMEGCQPDIMTANFSMFRWAWTCLQNMTSYGLYYKNIAILIISDKSLHFLLRKSVLRDILERFVSWKYIKMLHTYYYTKQNNPQKQWCIETIKKRKTKISQVWEQMTLDISCVTWHQCEHSAWYIVGRRVFLKAVCLARPHLVRVLYLSRFTDAGQG